MQDTIIAKKVAWVNRGEKKRREKLLPILSLFRGLLRGNLIKILLIVFFFKLLTSTTTFYRKLLDKKRLTLEDGLLGRSNCFIYWRQTTAKENYNRINLMMSPGRQIIQGGPRSTRNKLRRKWRRGRNSFIYKIYCIIFSYGKTRSRTKSNVLERPLGVLGNRTYVWSGKCRGVFTEEIRFK